MKVGDLVSLKMKKTSPPQEPMIGVVVEVTGNPFASIHHLPSQIKVHWQKHNHESPWMLPTKFHEVISESR